MATKTPFNITAQTPPPFDLGTVPIPNLTGIPAFVQTGGYIGGTFPEAAPATGFKPVTARNVLSGILPKASPQAQTNPARKK